MAKVKLMAGIESLHGKMVKVLLRTYKTFDKITENYHFL